jgi:hypothetical protein
MQNESVLLRARDTLIKDFNRDILRDKSSSGSITFMDETKIRAWIRWAAYLGWGILGSRNNKVILIPDATKRVRGILNQVIKLSETMTIQKFLDNLGANCPELDSGALYIYCQRSLGKMDTLRFSMFVSRYVMPNVPKPQM